jgi:hypothetical protein
VNQAVFLRLVSAAHAQETPALLSGRRRVPGVRERDLHPRHDFVARRVDLQDVSFTGLGFQGKHPDVSFSVPDVRGRDPELDLRELRVA